MDLLRIIAMSRETEERKLAVIMFTDMVGFTALTQSDEAKALKVLKKHEELLRPFFARFRGKEIKTLGDSFLVEFESALDATKCALEIQKFLREYNTVAQDSKIVLRIGIHLGDVVHRDKDTYGDAVNLASRIFPLADPGEICISQQVYDQINNKIDFLLAEVLHPDLKNVRTPMTIYRIAVSPNRLSDNENARTFPMDKRRIAVLPLANISPDPQDAYFADGMTEELIAALGSIDGLKVIARTSVTKYKSSQKTIAEISRELRVGTVLEGSVRKANDKIRVTVQLIDAESEEHLQAHTYDRELRNVFQIQSEISEAVAEGLKLYFEPSHKQEIEKRATDSVEAYSLYLKGRLRWDERSEPSIKAAISYFERAIELDPTYALAYGGLADCYLIQGVYSFIEPHSIFQKSEQLALKALELNENLAEAHATLGDLSMHYRHDWQKALEELQRAISLKPSYAPAYHWFSEYLACIGSLDAALIENQHAIDLDPLSLIIRDYRGKLLYCSHQYSDAEMVYREILSSEPNHAIAYKGLSEVHTFCGQYELAIAEAEKATDLSGGSIFIKDDLGYIYAKDGRRPEAYRVIEELKKASAAKFVPAYGIAVIYLELGEKDVGIEWLKKAVDQGTSPIELLKVDPVLESVRADPKFLDILEKMNLE